MNTTKGYLKMTSSVTQALEARDAAYEAFETANTAFLDAEYDLEEASIATTAAEEYAEATQAAMDDAWGDVSDFMQQYVEGDDANSWAQDALESALAAEDFYVDPFLDAQEIFIKAEAALTKAVNDLAEAEAKA